MICISPIPAFADNYIWILEAPPSNAVVVVDPGLAEPVLSVLSDRQLRPAAFLLTHHHGDHVDGLVELLRHHPAPVYGPARESISREVQPVQGGDRVPLLELRHDLFLDVLDVPGHTSGHVAYYAPGFALVGDTLFAGGCGRVFEGTTEQMFESLRKLAALPPETEIYCAHEYTVGNLRFALHVSPENETLADRLRTARAEREAGRPTVPSTLARELDTNPFLRCTEAEIIAAAEAHAGRPLAPGAEVFAVIRGWKDGWQG
ncbi:MAG: hydroxyacylglutathione hydrolase [Thermoanaerobaculales bacterium]